MIERRQLRWLLFPFASQFWGLFPTIDETKTQHAFLSSTLLQHCSVHNWMQLRLKSTIAERGGDKKRGRASRRGRGVTMGVIVLFSSRICRLDREHFGQSVAFLSNTPAQRISLGDNDAFDEFAHNLLDGSVAFRVCLYQEYCSFGRWASCCCRRRHRRWLRIRKREDRSVVVSKLNFIGRTETAADITHVWMDAWHRFKTNKTFSSPMEAENPTKFMLARDLFLLYLYVLII